ncbi:MAG: RNA polymerase factor sigma-54 [Chloroflexi bacterium]|nr:MAG: RNA polymerase factor sigma-54 [Chloroflexota bacterium]
MSIEVSHQLIPTMQAKVTPKQIVANRILAMSSVELQQAIAEELDENPALEQVEEAVCPTCGGATFGGTCPNCSPRSEGPTATELFEPSPGPARDDPDADDPIARAEASFTLQEHLDWNLRSLLPRELHEVATWVIGELDENGLLTRTDEEIARESGGTAGAVARVRSAMRGLEPIGIGARDVRESLLLQLGHLRETGHGVPGIAEALVTDHLQALADRHFREIAHVLGVSEHEVLEAWEFIKTNLHPYPASAFVAATRGDGPRQILRPDVLIRIVDGELEVEVVESRRFSLRVAASYASVSAALRSPTWSDQEKEHVREHVGRARFFIDAVRRRRATLQRIAATLVKRQHDYLVHGVRHLVPLTRAEVASEIGVHESTVSRATAEKFVMVPSGEVVPFSHFFTASLSIKDQIRAMIEGEDQDHPMSDQQIADELLAQGVAIARRTVAKYRDELRILPARLRHS